MAARQIRRRFLHPVREIRRILQERYATDVTVLLQKILDLGGQEIPSGTWKITSTLHVSSGLSGVTVRLDTDDPDMAVISFAPRNLMNRGKIPEAAEFEHTGMGICNKGRRHAPPCDFGNGF